MSSASPSAPPGYTAKQGQYLAFIHAYRRLHDQAPAEADIQRFFRVSPPSVHQMILKLEQAGLITRQPGALRANDDETKSFRDFRLEGAEGSPR